MKRPIVGDIVIYRPDKRLPEFHDHGVETVLPAIVVKVWEFPEGDVSVNLAVCPKVDIRVLLNSNEKPVLVFAARYSEEAAQDTWSWPR